MTETTSSPEQLARVEEFFADYAAALLARDEHRVAKAYAVPALILFPGQSVPVTDRQQTEEFFAASWGQYQGVESAEPQITLMGAGPQTVWAEVAWSYDGSVRERFCYQLVAAAPDADYRIAVLTFLG